MERPGLRWSNNKKYFANLISYEGNCDLKIYDADFKLLINKKEAGYNPAISPDGKYFASINGKDGMAALYNMEGELLHSLGKHEYYGEGNSPMTTGKAYLTEKHAYVMIYDNSHEKEPEKRYVEFYVLNYDGSIKTKIRENSISYSSHPAFYVFPDEDKFAVSFHNLATFTGHTDIYTIDGEKVLSVPSVSEIFNISENPKYLLLSSRIGTHNGYLINTMKMDYYEINVFCGNGELKVLNNGKVLDIYESKMVLTSINIRKEIQKVNNNIAYKYSFKICPVKNMFAEIVNTNEEKQKIIMRKSSEKLRARMSEIMRRRENEE